LIAGTANLSVTVIKIIAGALTGSSAMLAEAAHSAADTLNQGFLLASLQRSTRSADADQPLGYGPGALILVAARRVRHIHRRRRILGFRRHPGAQPDRGFP
jgi:Co/Zn/Cd efflux system component